MLETKLLGFLADTSPLTAEGAKAATHGA
jgi:hypothetical protein